MKQERIGTSAPKENAGPGLLAGSLGLAAKAENLKLKAALGVGDGGTLRVLKDRKFGRLLGNPCVIIWRERSRAFVLLRCFRTERRGTEEQTIIERAPWGWSNADREFLNPDSPGVNRYALRLVRRIREEGTEEHARRSRAVALRLAERERDR